MNECEREQKDRWACERALDDLAQLVARSTASVLDRDDDGIPVAVDIVLPCGATLCLMIWSNDYSYWRTDCGCDTERQ